MSPRGFSECTYTSPVGGRTDEAGGLGGVAGAGAARAVEEALSAIGQRYAPERRTAVFDWHVAHHAEFEPVGNWRRP